MLKFLLAPQVSYLYMFLAVFSSGMIARSQYAEAILALVLGVGSEIWYSERVRRQAKALSLK